MSTDLLQTHIMTSSASSQAAADADKSTAASVEGQGHDPVEDAVDVVAAAAASIEMMTRLGQDDLNDDNDDMALAEVAGMPTDSDQGDSSLLEQQSAEGSTYRIEAENRQLVAEVDQLRREILRLQHQQALAAGNNASSVNLCNSMQLELIQTNQELSRCRETLRAMKADRKRLKLEKSDLVGQMKQLYGTLKDKEAELRDFIRNYEQRNRDMMDGLKQLVTEKEELLRQVNEATNKAREATEQCAALRLEMELKNDTIQKLHQQIFKQPSDLTQLIKTNAANTSSSVINDSMRSRSSHCGDGGLYSNSSGEDLPPYQEIFLVGNDANGTGTPNIPRTASLSEAQGRPLLNQRIRALAQRVPRTTLGPIRRYDRSQLASLEQDTNHDAETTRRHNSFTGTLSSGVYSTLSSTDSHVPPRPAFLNTQRNYQEKLHSLDEAHELSVTEWKANHVLTWLELDMNMSSYGQTCVDNIKSGKILLGLSDSELEAALRLESVLHRRKLRLAIEELRDPSTVQFKNASKIDHFWIAHDWLHSLGLAQYSASFESQLVDARLLNVLGKKDLDKYLSVHRKFHQSSILYGVQLLRMIDFDRQKLQLRRAQIREEHTDPLVWTNLRVRQWAESIDLQEYAENLKDSGVHGAVLVLDQSFTAEVLAAILGIPASKSYVRRHLATELDALIKPARAALETWKKSTSGSRSGLTRSYSGSGAKSDSEASSTRGSGRKLNLKGSFARAFGRRSQRDSSHPAAARSSSASKDSKLSSSESMSSIDLRHHHQQQQQQ